MYGNLKLETKKSGQVVGCCYTYINGEERIEWLCQRFRENVANMAL
jgi:hypothetical protein